jgi:hypothetical protein
MATPTLDSRVRRLEQILASRARDGDSASGQDDAAVAALKQFSMVLRSLQQLTDEVHARIGVGDWDAGDALAARLLLDVLTSALRSSRVVSNDSASRLLDVERTLRAGDNFLRHEPTRTQEA